MRNWTAEQRQRQREIIQNWKPWTKSTGAKTEAGKKRSSKNATKNGDSLEARKVIKLLNQLLKQQRQFLNK